MITDPGVKAALEALVRRRPTCVSETVRPIGERIDASHSGRSAEFNEFLAAVIVNLRRGESLDLVTLKVKARLTQTYPSLTISPSRSPYRDALTSAQCFGLTFNSKRVLSASDRRFLKANGQLISMLEDCRREMREMREDTTTQSPQSPKVIYSPAEWMDTRSSLSA